MARYAPAFNITSTEHLQILKAMVISKTTWTLRCEEFKEKDYDSTKFNIDEKSNTINFPYALTKCPWYSCDGRTLYSYDAIGEKDFLEALSSAI